jgi:Skp family chaperone for outer membrane proteins
MNNRLHIILLATLLASAFPATAAADSAETVPFKIGYFDVDEVLEQVNGKQQPLIRLVESPRKQKFQVISSAAESVAKQQNLDVILDQDGIWHGKEEVTKIGQDVTEDIRSDLMGNTRRPTAPTEPN